MGGDLSPLDVIHFTQAVELMPDGSKMPEGLKATLNALATHWPNIWPGQERLARDMCVSRSAVNRRLRILEDADLIRRTRRGSQSTSYWLNLGLMRLCIASDTSYVPPVIQEEQY